MQSTMRKSVRCLACLALILAISLSLIPVSASAASGWPGVSSSALLEFKAAGTIAVYNSADCSRRGTAEPKLAYNAAISAGDVCCVSSFTGSGSVYVKYPVGSGYRWGYARIRDVFLADAPSRSFAAADGCTVYSDTSGHSYGSVAAGDAVLVLGSSGSYTMVIYDAVSGSRRYKAGFVSASDLSRIAPAEELVLKFQVHVAQIGNMAAAELRPGASVTVGTTGRGLAIEEITSSVVSGDATLALAVHAQNVGTSATAEGKSVTQGSQGQGRRLEAVWLELKGPAAGQYALEYRAHVQNVGWQDWVSGGKMAGTTGKGLRLEALEIRLAKKDAPASQLRWPVTDVYVCGNDYNEYSAAKAKEGRPYHLGVDICSSTGDTSIYAFADGTVAAADYNSANGNFVVLRHERGGQTFYSFYAHLSRITVSKGDSLKAGDALGVIGNTGSSSRGTHLHFAIVSTLWAKGSYWGYGPQKGSSVSYDGVTYYDPYYVVQNGSLPS